VAKEMKEQQQFDLSNKCSCEDDDGQQKDAIFRQLYTTIWFQTASLDRTTDGNFWLPRSFIQV
jgi:hypothetical protein